MSAFDLQMDDGFDLQIEDETPKPPPRPKKSGTEAVARGAAQGATANFADEIAGAAGAMGEGAASLGAGPLPPQAAFANWLAQQFGWGTPFKQPESTPVPQREFADAYRAERDEYRAGDEASREDHPGKYLASQLGGALVTAPLTGPVGTVGQAVKTGAMFGAAAGLGGSQADVTQGDVGGAAKDTVVGGAIGAAAGPVAYGATKLIGAGIGAAGRAIGNRVGGEPTRVTRAAEAVAKETAKHADEPSLIGRNETVRSSTQKANELMQEWAAMGVPLKLRASSITGDRAAALAESRMAQFPGTMQKVQAEEFTRLDQASKLADMYRDRLAADPSRLGLKEVAEGLGRAVKNRIKALYGARSAAAEPLYAEAERLGGGVDAAPVLGAVKQILAENKLNPSKMTGQLGSMLEKLESAGAGGGLSLREANNFRKLMNGAIRRETSLLDGVDMDVQGRIARTIRESIDEAFTAAESSASGPGIEALRKANAAWRVGSEAIEEAESDTVKYVLGKTQSDALESVPGRLLKLKPEQMAGLMRVVNEASPYHAKQLGAQMIDEILLGAGRANPLAPQAAQRGVTQLSPGTALKNLEKAEPVLQAIYSGDAKAQMAIGRLYDLLQRTAFGPNLRGSQTSSLAADFATDLATKVAETTTGAAGGKVTKQAIGLAGRLLGNNEAVVNAVNTTRGIEDFMRALLPLFGAKSGRPVSDKVALEAIAALSRLGVMPISEAAPQRIAPGLTASRE